MPFQNSASQYYLCNVFLVVIVLFNIAIANIHALTSPLSYVIKVLELKHAFAFPA